jgi:hypothetical protein
MNWLKSGFITLFFILLFVSSQAQQKNVTKRQTIAQIDSAFLKHPIKDKLLEIKSDITKKWNKTFVDFKNNEVYVFGGLSLSKQNITTGNYNSNFNYDLSNYNKSAYKPGYTAGVRIDGLFREKHLYSFIFSLDKLATGTEYKNSASLSPFLGSFSKFKADDQFLNLTFAAHYKKTIPFIHLNNKTFYVVGGPSIETRLSRQSIDNLVNYNYRRFLLRADLGVEFNNNDFYTFFIHYKQGVSSFTKAPVSTTMNSVQLGLMIKASDIF